MTITLYLQKETLLRDLQTIIGISKYTVDTIEKVKQYYEPLKVTTEKMMFPQVAIQVTPEEFALIGVFNGGI